MALACPTVHDAAIKAQFNINLYIASMPFSFLFFLEASYSFTIYTRSKSKTFTLEMYCYVYNFVESKVKTQYTSYIVSLYHLFNCITIISKCVSLSQDNL